MSKNRRKVRTTGVLISMGNRPSYFRDDGCEASPSCLECPLPVCKHDWHGMKDAVKVDEIEHLGLTEEVAAVRYGIGVRSVRRMIQRVRRARHEKQAAGSAA